MKQLKVNSTWLKRTSALSDAEKGRLFTAMLQYAIDGGAPALSGREALLWDEAQDQIDQQRSISEKRSVAGKSGADKRWQTIANDSKPWQTIANDSKEKALPIPPEPPITPVKENLKKTPPKGGAKESTLSPALQDAVNAFKEMRQKMRKPMTPLAVDLLVQKLQKLAPGDEQKQVAMLMQSIENGWSGVYELKTDQVRGKKTGPHTFFNYKEKGECVDLKSIEATLDTDFGGPSEGLARSRKNNTLLNYNETQTEVKPIELNLEEL